MKMDKTRREHLTDAKLLLGQVRPCEDNLAPSEYTSLPVTPLNGEDKIPVQLNQLDTTVNLKQMLSGSV